MNRRKRSNIFSYSKKGVPKLHVSLDETLIQFGGSIQIRLRFDGVTSHMAPNENDFLIRIDLPIGLRVPHDVSPCGGTARGTGRNASRAPWTLPLGVQ